MNFPSFTLYLPVTWTFSLKSPRLGCLRLAGLVFFLQNVFYKHMKMLNQALICLGQSGFKIYAQNMLTKC